MESCTHQGLTYVVSLCDIQMSCQHFIRQGLWSVDFWFHLENQIKCSPGSLLLCGSHRQHAPGHTATQLAVAGP